MQKLKFFNHEPDTNREDKNPQQMEIILSVSFQQEYHHHIYTTAEKQEEIIRTEVEAALKKLNPNKFAGVDGIVAVIPYAIGYGNKESGQLTG